MYKPAEKRDVNGKQIPVSYFGNLSEKQDIAAGYLKMYNQIAFGEGVPQIDVIRELEQIRKRHDRFYGNDNKYDGKGNLK